MSYSDFAEFYDIFTRDVDYSARTEQLLRIFEKHGKRPTLLLDAACGTGGFLFEFLRRGVDAIGVDISPEMLIRARKKAEFAGLSPLLLCQPLEELDLFGTVDGAVCMLDSLNHITDLAELRRSVARISLFLEPGSLFIFDLNTLYKHREILADNTFVFEEDDAVCIWRNEYDEDARRTDIFLDFFAARGDVYRRYSDEFSEVYYDGECIREILEAAGLELIEVIPEGDGDECQREIFVSRRRGDPAVKTLRGGATPLSGRFAVGTDLVP